MTTVEFSEPASSLPRRSPTLEELLPPVVPTRPFHVRHRKKLIAAATAFVLGAVGVIYVVTHQPRTVFDAKPGECIGGQVARDGTQGKISIIACGSPHIAEVYATGTAGHDVESATDPDAIRICQTNVDPRLLHELATADGATVGLLTSFDGDGKVLCIAFSDSSRMGSYVAAAAN